MSFLNYTKKDTKMGEVNYYLLEKMKNELGLNESKTRVKTLGYKTVLKKVDPSKLKPISVSSIDSDAEAKSCKKLPERGREKIIYLQGVESYIFRQGTWFKLNSKDNKFYPVL